MMSPLLRLLRRLVNALLPGRAEAARAREVAAHLALIELGLAGAVAASRWMGSMIFGVEPLDPVTLVAVPIVLLVSSAIAAAAPARRASRGDGDATARVIRASLNPAAPPR